MSRTGLDAETLARSLRARAGDGSIEWDCEPIQTSVLLDVADMLDDNAKLRELVRDLWEACPADGYYCIYHCEHYDKESESHCKLEDRMAELGIEVD